MPLGTSHRQPWMVGTALFLLTATIYLATAGYRTASVDVVSADIGAWRIATTGAPWLDGLDLSPVDTAKASIFVTAGPDGTVIARSPGVIAAGVPAYALAELIDPSGTDLSSFSLGPAAATAALLTACSTLLMWASLAGIAGIWTRTTVAAAFAFTTPVWSVAADGMWTHTLTVFGISGTAWAASRQRWWLVGLFGGVALWGRLHTVLITACVGLWCAFEQRRARIAVSAAFSGAVMAGLAALWTHWHYDRWIPSGAYDTSRYAERIDNAGSSYANDPLLLLPNELGLWVSLDRGILIWTPLLVVLAPALWRSWPSQQAWTRSLIVGGFIYTLLQGWVNVFHGGDAFYGYRHGLEFLACAVPAFTAAIPHVGRIGRVVIAPVLALQLSAFTLGGVLGRPLLHFDAAWDHNAFASALASAPALGVVTVLAVLAAILVQRIWWPVTPSPEGSVGGSV